MNLLLDLPSFRTSAQEPIGTEFQFIKPLRLSASSRMCYGNTVALVLSRTTMDLQGPFRNFTTVGCFTSDETKKKRGLDDLDDLDEPKKGEERGQKKGCAANL